MSDISKLLSFIEFTKKFKEVERAIIWKHDNRKENDSEHSFQLALVGWYVAETNKLNLNSDAIIRYALVHDLVEIYAGDTPIHTEDNEYKESKHAREEEEALIQIEKELKEFPELTEWIKKYETREDEEARFVYALDKLIPVINIYLDKGHSWHKNSITYTMLINNKEDKIALSPEIAHYWELLKDILKKDAKWLFPDDTLS